MLGPKSLAALAPLLEDPDNPTPNERGELYMYCPYHGDKKRSASISIETGLWFCSGCEDSGQAKALIADSANWVIEENRESGSGSGGGSGKAPRRTFDMTEAEVEGWTESLLTNNEVLQEIITRRGLSLETLIQYEIGWDRRYRAYTIPVRDRYGELVNYRFYRFDPPEGRRKIWSVAGRGTPPTLFPVDQLDHDTIVICEGEWDALFTIQKGLPAITRTSAADAWIGVWSRQFYGKDVILCHDMDLKGQRANDKIYEALRQHAHSVSVVRLPYPVDPKHGKDLTDYWLAGHTKEDFLALAVPMGLTDEQKVEEDVPDATISVGILDTLDDPGLAGQVLKMPVTISGRNMDNWLIPHVYDISCPIDQGNKCNKCSMQTTGHITGTIERRDPMVLALTGINDEALKEKMLKRHSVVTKCPTVQLVRTQDMRVEQLFVRPSLEASSEDERQDFTQRKVISSAPTTGLADNMIVDLYGSIMPNPNNQRNEFLAWGVNKPPSLLDDWDITPEVATKLKRFQDKGDPLAKCMDIAKDTIDTVTGIKDREIMHVFIDLVFHSALDIEMFGENEPQKGTLDALILGDTRTGKSLAAGKMLADYGVGDMVNCESASLAGIMGGLEKVNDGGFVVKWGSLPVNDKRVVVLDEVSGLTVDQISQLTDVRARRKAKIEKIKTAQAHARTRLLWLSNYRKNSNPASGLEGMRQLIGMPEDIARFDMVMGVFSTEVDSEVINPNEVTAMPTKRKYSQAARRDCLRWGWTRRHDQIIMAKEVTEYNNVQARDLSERYSADPPLVVASNIRWKLARIATAFALRTFSCDETFQLCVVKPKHVDAAVQFLDAIYGNIRFGYEMASQQSNQLSQTAAQEEAEIMQFLSNYQGLQYFLFKEDYFDARQMATILDMGEDGVSHIIQFLYKLGLVKTSKNVRGAMEVDPTLRQKLQTTSIGDSE